MANRDIRTVNATEGQKIENDTVIKRIGDISLRNMGVISQMSLFDSGKALIVGDGLRVEPSSGMTVNIPSGSIFQRTTEVLPCVQPTAQTVTLDAADGVARTDIIEAKVVSVTDKDDVSQVATVASGSAVSITNETIKRDIKYYLSVRKQKGTTTPTAATAGTLTGTVAIAGTIDLSSRYLINLADGEDGSFQEIDLRGATPEATTLAEINANINAAVGRTMATTGAGDVGVLTGVGTGETSYFQIKPPVTDTDKDALNVVFGVSIGGVYKYTYQGSNEWIKIAEIDVGTATTTITSTLIRNIDKKDTWTGNIQDIIVQEPIFKQNVSEWNSYDSGTTYDQWDVAFIGDDQYVSIKGSNNGNDPILSPNYWKKSPKWDEVVNLYQDGALCDSGMKNIHNYRETDYENWFFIGYYSYNGKNYNAYGVHLDSTTVTGDSDLENTIFKVGEPDEYFLLDNIAPDSVGTRTLTDSKGTYKRCVDAASGETEDPGVRQEDAMQRVTGDLLIQTNTDVSVRAFIPASQGGVFSTAASGTSSAIDSLGSGGTSKGSTLNFDSNDSTSPNPAKTTDTETRVKTTVNGLLYIVVIVQV